ncbi:hypothetical protein OC844_007505, partial [Tilletia horrida]
SKIQQVMSPGTTPTERTSGLDALAALGAGLPEEAYLALQDIARRAREGTPISEALQQVALTTTAGGRGSSARGGEGDGLTVMQKKAVVDTSAYQLAYRTAEALPKLEYNTYSTWYSKFWTHIQLIPKAVDHLDWTEFPAGFKKPGWAAPAVMPTPGYDAELDLALGTLMEKTIGPKLNMIATREARKPGGNLLTHKHAALKERVSRADASTQIAIEGKLAGLRQSKESIAKLGDKLIDLFNEAENAGLVIDERKQVSHLLRAVSERYNSRRSIILDELDKGNEVNFFAALEKFQQEETLFDQQTSDDVQGVARKTHKEGSADGNTGRTGGTAAAAGGGGRGGARADGGNKHQPSGGPICWKCQQPGHIKANCPNKRKVKKSLDNKTHTKHEDRQGDLARDTFSRE